MEPGAHSRPPQDSINKVRIPGEGRGGGAGSGSHGARLVDVFPAASRAMLLVAHCRDSSRGLGILRITFSPGFKGHTCYSQKAQVVESGLHP